MRSSNHFSHGNLATVPESTKLIVVDCLMNRIDVVLAIDMLRLLYSSGFSERLAPSRASSAQ
jgi:hypothetical protein